jgi:hypothetical protein
VERAREETEKNASVEAGGGTSGGGNGEQKLETFLRYEGGGIGGGPAVAIQQPVGAVSVRPFVGSTLVKGDPRSKRLTDFRLSPRSAVGGMAVRF